MGFEKGREWVEPCGCVCAIWSDDWFRAKIWCSKRCDTCDHNDRLNQEVDKKEQEIREYIRNEAINHEHALNEKMETIECEYVPIKYYYDTFNIKQRVFKRVCDIHSKDVSRFKLHKQNTRYYCCKNRIDYYINRPPEDYHIHAGLEEEYCEMKGWTNDDFVYHPVVETDDY